MENQEKDLRDEVKTLQQDLDDCLKEKDQILERKEEYKSRLNYKLIIFFVAKILSVSFSISNQL